MTPADPPPDYLLRVRSLDGALCKAQSLALRELGPLAEGVTGDLGRALQRLAAALKEGSPSQIGSAVLACKTRMRGEMLVRFQKVEAVIATHYRWCYLQTQQLSADLDQLLDLAGELHELAYRKSS